MRYTGSGTQGFTACTPSDVSFVIPQPIRGPPVEGRPWIHRTDNEAKRLCPVKYEGEQHPFLRGQGVSIIWRQHTAKTDGHGSVAQGLSHGMRGFPQRVKRTMCDGPSSFSAESVKRTPKTAPYFSGRSCFFIKGR